MESSEHNWANISDNLTHNASFWQIGILDVVLSVYLDKSHNFSNLIFYVVTLWYSIRFSSLIAFFQIEWLQKSCILVADDSLSFPPYPLLLLLRQATNIYNVMMKQSALKRSKMWRPFLN